MKTTNRIICLLALGATFALGAKEKNIGTMRIDSTQCTHNGDEMVLTATLRLDSLCLGSNDQLFVRPIIKGANEEMEVYPAVLIDGRNMHYIYERKGISKKLRQTYSDLAQVVRRHNGTEQSVAYVASLPVQSWMLSPETEVTFAVDTCGCGNLLGNGALEPVKPFTLPEMLLVYITPEVTELPITVHEGKAKVQFEVDRTELHDQPYRTKRSGQLIDNRAQLKMIDDTVTYALTNPNVEIARIDVCGYASPESPYLHNDELATGRSRALAEYLAAKYNLPKEASHYSAVPENWAGFRDFVVNDTKKLTAQQRADLLELIDAPAYGPSDYDAKEKALKTDRRYAELYRTFILPVWFPELRVTHFAISTRLRPLSDPQLAEVILVTPELMSLNQMFRVARLYEEGTPEFNRTIDIALTYFPNDPVANLNAAVAALKADDLDRAARLLAKAGNSPEAENARGVLAVKRKDYDAARAHFKAAGRLHEAVLNSDALNW